MNYLKTQNNNLLTKVIIEDRGVHQVESFVAMQAHFTAMSKDIKQLTIAQVQNKKQPGCDICGMGHPTHERQTSTTKEEVMALGLFWSSSSGSLNSWKKQNSILPVQGPPGFQDQQRQK